jgi:Arm DNA-binding domain
MRILPVTAIRGRSLTYAPFRAIFVGTLVRTWFDSDIGDRLMARAIHRLKSIEVDRLAKQPGMHHDGGGLYLSTDGQAQCSWLFRYMIHRRGRAMGLGPYPTITLAEARNRAAECRRLLVDRIDPIEHRHADRTRERLEP